MNDKWKWFYIHAHSWKFWIALVGLGLLVWALVLAFVDFVGPYVAGLWIIHS